MRADRPRPLPRLSASPGFCSALGALWFLDGFGFTGPILLAAALHELGHLAALRLLGIPVYAVELRASGAVIRTRLTGRARELWAVAAGPAVNLLLFLLFRRARPLFSLCNLALAAWNLLPLSALDGGRFCAVALPCLFGRPGQVLCQLLHRATLLGLVLLGIWGTFVLRLGLLPALGAAFFLLRAPKGLDKPAADW